MATFEDILEYNASQLEALTDEQLLEYLGPCLKNCPPIDIAVFNKKQDEIKAKKQEEKALKQLAEGKLPKTPKTAKTKGKLTKGEELRQMKSMIDGLASMLQIGEEGESKPT